MSELREDAEKQASQSRESDASERFAGELIESGGFAFRQAPDCREPEGTTLVFTPIGQDPEKQERIEARPQRQPVPSGAEHPTEEPTRERPQVAPRQELPHLVLTAFADKEIETQPLLAAAPGPAGVRGEPVLPPVLPVLPVLPPVLPVAASGAASDGRTSNAACVALPGILSGISNLVPAVTPTVNSGGHGSDVSLAYLSAGKKEQDERGGLQCVLPPNNSDNGYHEQIHDVFNQGQLPAPVKPDGSLLSQLSGGLPRTYSPAPEQPLISVTSCLAPNNSGGQDKLPDSSAAIPCQDWQHRGGGLAGNVSGEEVLTLSRISNQLLKDVTGSGGGNANSSRAAGESDESRAAHPVIQAEQPSGSGPFKIESNSLVQNMSKKELVEDSFLIIRRYLGPGSRNEVSETTGAEAAAGYRRYLPTAELQKTSILPDAADPASMSRTVKNPAADAVTGLNPRLQPDSALSGGGEVRAPSDLLKGRNAGGQGEMAQKILACPDGIRSASDLMRPANGGLAEVSVSGRVLDSRPVIGADGKPLIGADGKPLIGADGKPLIGADGKPLFSGERSAGLTATDLSISRGHGDERTTGAGNSGDTVFGAVRGLPGDLDDSPGVKPGADAGALSAPDEAQGRKETSDKKAGTGKEGEGEQDGADAGALTNSAMAARTRKDDKNAKQDRGGKPQELPQQERRLKHVVREGETLESIAKERLGNARFASLILTINRAAILFKKGADRQEPVLREGQILWLPTSTEMAIYRGTYFGGTTGKKHVFASRILQEIEGHVMPADFQAPELVIDGQATKLSAVTGGISRMPSRQALPIASAETRDTGYPLESRDTGGGATVAKSDQRRLHRVRLGETLRSISLRDPLMADASLWPLLARINGLPTETDAAGRPLAVLARGRAIQLPTISEIASFKEPESSDCLSGSVQMLSANCRLVGADHGEAVGFKLRLQIRINNVWVTIASYELAGGRAVRCLWSRGGSSEVFAINLPPRVVRQMAMEDFGRNWQSICRQYVACSRAPELAVH